jgi:hypothetical protein
MPSNDSAQTVPEGRTLAGADRSGPSELEPDELDVIELPDRQALSVFTGGIGHLRVGIPEAAPPPESSTET